MGAPELKVEDDQDRGRGRYPEVCPLPDRPSLDRLQYEAGTPLTWDTTSAGGRGLTTWLTWAVPRPPALPTSSPGTLRFKPFMGDGDAADASTFEERLVRSLDQGGLLVLTVHPRIARQAEAELHY